MKSITDLNLPVSKVYDPLMPVTQSASVTLTVLEDNRLNVSVTVVPTGDGGDGTAELPASLFKRTALGPNGKVTPIIRPGGSADIEVKVSAYSWGGCLFSATGLQLAVIYLRLIGYTYWLLPSRHPAACTCC